MFDMPECSHNANSIASPILRNLPNDMLIALRHNSHMTKLIRTFDPDEGDVEANANHLRAWLQFRKKTQAWLAKQLATSPSVVSDLISGNRALSPKWLRRIAPLLNTTPGWLLDHDPNSLPSDLFVVWEEVDPSLRERAIEALKAFKRAS